jgi:hypothetical protein
MALFKNNWLFSTDAMGGYEDENQKNGEDDFSYIFVFIDLFL